MKRRDFFEKSGCGLAGLFITSCGLISCSKEEASIGSESPLQPPVQETAKEDISRKDMVKKMLVEKMGNTEEEAEAKIVEIEEKLPMVKDMCICKTCPTYVSEETETGFCHPLVGKSKIIKDEKGCNCPTCPVYKKMELKNGYYCTRKSEMEQELAKKK
ncbi:DUF2769 domain-containing protein [Acidobacteriota bacterium]